MTQRVLVPDFFVVHQKSHADRTALERFVHDNEPAGKADEELFRDGLQAVLDEVTNVS